MRCAQCDTENPGQAKFCLNCGTRLGEVCPQCDATLPPQARFCTECGTQVGAPLPPVPPAPAPGFLTERLQRLVPQEYAERLLATKGQVESERRLATMLFSDVKGSTAMAEALDPEEMMEIMNGAFDVIIEPITRHEGTLASLIGDAVLAVFGAPLSHEDDPERAVRAALEIMEGAQAYAAQLEAERGLTGFDLRVGINTGVVVVGEVGTDLRVEYTAMGDAVNLAARLEQHAPVGGILISHYTYHHVRGVFDVVPQEPLTVRGKAEPVLTYVVQQAKPRAFRKGTRGVEGIETRMVGREAELKRLQDASYTVVEDGECQVVTVVGEAGVGKSRLLHEFDLWTELQPETLHTFKGRAGKEMQQVPYALLRDLFSFRFQIRENDPGDVARDKLVRGITTGYQVAEAGIQSQSPDPKSEIEMRAHIIGQLLGFDFGASPHVQAIGGDAQQLRDRAVIYIGEYFRALAARQPVLMLLEDLHWADDSSLDAVNRLAMRLSVGAEHPSPLLIVGAARPSLYERRPHWGEGQLFHTRLDLSRLSRRDSRLLVAEILQKVAEVPAAVRDLVVGGAEGNPFFLEELIKVLIEQGVIHKGEAAWSVEPERLRDLRVPPTLIGVLQARLDRLPIDERLVLQQASVVGRLFWDRAVAHIATEAKTELDPDEVRAALSALRGREMVFRRETSAFEGGHEYLFKHATLREVTYESVLKRVRRVYHRLAAEWLMEQTGDRAGEYTGLIADHFTLAGAREEAGACLRRAGERAAAAYANAEAAAYYSRALELTAADNAEERYTLLLAREKLYGLQGGREAQARDLTALEALARVLDKAGPPEERLRGVEVALRRAKYAEATSDYPTAVATSQTAVRLAQSAQEATTGTVDSESARLQSVRLESAGYLIWGTALWRQGEYAAARSQLEGALTLARTIQLRDLEADSLRNLGLVCLNEGDYARAEEYFEQTLRITPEIGDPQGECVALNSLGIVSSSQGHYARARDLYERSLHISREIGDRRSESVALNNLGTVVQYQGDYSEARSYFEQVLRLFREVGDRQSESLALGNLGDVADYQGDYVTARDYYTRSLSILREIGDRQVEGWMLGNLGNVCDSLGAYADARAFHDEALLVLRDVGDRRGEGFVLSNLGLLCHHMGDDQAAREHIQQALHITRDIGDRLNQGYAWTNLGHVQVSLGHLDEAAKAYRRALDLRRELVQENLAIESQAGLAHVSMLQGDRAQALMHIEEILQYLEADPVLEGTDQPLRVYLTCYRVLCDSEDPRAQGILTTAFKLLQEQAAKIDDGAVKRSFLEEVPSHRELVQEYERAGHAG